MSDPPTPDPSRLPAVGSVWTERPRHDPLTLTGDGLVVVTEATLGLWGPRCTVVPLGAGGILSGPTADVLHRRTCIGTVGHAYTERDLRDAQGAAARRLKADALALARAWYEAGGVAPPQDGAG